MASSRMSLVAARPQSHTPPNTPNTTRPFTSVHSTLPHPTQSRYASNLPPHHLAPPEPWRANYSRAMSICLRFYACASQWRWIKSADLTHLGEFATRALHMDLSIHSMYAAHVRHAHGACSMCNMCIAHTRQLHMHLGHAQYVHSTHTHTHTRTMCMVCIH